MLTSINHLLHLICFHIQSHVGHTLLVTIFKTDLMPSKHLRDVDDIKIMHLDKTQRLMTEVNRSDQPPTLEHRLRLTVANIATKTIFMCLYDYIDVGDGCWRRNVLVTVLAILVTNILYLLTIAPTFKICRQYSNSVVSILKLSRMVCHQHHNVTDVAVAVFTAIKSLECHYWDSHRLSCPFHEVLIMLKARKSIKNQFKTILKLFLFYR